MEYRLEESKEGFSAQVVSPVFRPDQRSEIGERPKIRPIDEGKDKKGETSSSQLNDEIESKKRKLDEEAKLAEQKARELEKQAEEARRKKAELENFTPRQQVPQK
jgi:predicted  nucleic acid-binding Zn-ribbon protein